MGNTIIGNGKKQHAELYVKGVFIGRVVYYYWSKSDNLIRLHDKNKYVIAQFNPQAVVVLLEEVSEEEPVEDVPYYGEE